VPTAAVAAVVEDNCDNGNDGSGVDGGVMIADAVMVNAMAAVAAMATAMAVARR
jgi:hypothetical protein